MNVMQWMVEQLQKDSECCGNCIECNIKFTQYTDFQYANVEEVVEQ